MAVQVTLTHMSRKFTTSHMRRCGDAVSRVVKLFPASLLEIFCTSNYERPIEQRVMLNMNVTTHALLAAFVVDKSRDCGERVRKIPVV